MINSAQNGQKTSIFITETRRATVLSSQWLQLLRIARRPVIARWNINMIPLKLVNTGISTTGILRAHSLSYQNIQVADEYI